MPILGHEWIESRFMYRNAYILTRERERPSSLETGQSEILFLHGKYGDFNQWQILSDRLGERSVYKMLELPGLGHSACLESHHLSFHEYIELTVELYKAARSPFSRRVIIGHDFGALIAQLAAVQLSRLENPISVDLILISPCSFEQFELRRLFKLLRPASRQLLSRIRESWPGPLERIAWTRMMKQYPGSLLLLRGSEDPFSSDLCIHEILSVYRDVEYFESLKGGKWPLLDDTEWIAEKMQNFLFRMQAKAS